MNFSDAYYDMVSKGTTFQLKSKMWSGVATLDYSDEIKKYIKKYNAKSLLDYGCGKGHQYIEGSPVSFGEDHLTFDKYLGVETVYKFDPCIKEFSQFPPEQKFDAVIVIQAIGNIPDDDLPLLKNILMNYSGKFCFIGNLVPGRVKKEKVDMQNKEFFKATRTKEWYEEQFKDWQGSELILHWI